MNENDDFLDMAAVGYEESEERNKRMVSDEADEHKPVYVTCWCKEGDRGCVPVQDTSPRENTSICLCFQRETGFPWPCYLTSAWTEEKCYFCSKTLTCSHPADNPDWSLPMISIPCLCQTVSNLCVRLPPDGEVEWYKLEHSTVKVTTPFSTTSTASAEVVKNLDIEVSMDE